MNMKIESIKNVNITALFSSPLNHLLISQKDLLDLFKTEDQENDKHTFIEAPGLKVLSFPSKQKEIIFEATRILVNDKTGRQIENIEVVDNLRNILKIGLIDQDKLTAYGFNYDVVVSSDSNFNINNLVGNKIASIENIKSAGANFSFEKNNIIYTLDIKPIRDEQKFVAHFNAHFNVSKLPDLQELKKEIKIQFEELKNVLQKI
jgi:hypothetical protein